MSAAIEYTDVVVLVKPDGVARNKVHLIRTLFRLLYNGGVREEVSLFEEKQVVFDLSRRFAEHYADKQSEPFFVALVHEMSTQGPIHVMRFRVPVTEGDSPAAVIARGRETMRTVREAIAVDFRNNTVHVSDSPAEGRREAKLWGFDCR